MWQNSNYSFGLVHIFLHWLMAFTVLGLFLLGLTMVELGYYDPWYHRAPAIHKSIGLLLGGVFLARLAWRFANPVPRSLAGTRWLSRAASTAHCLLYLSLLGMFVSGYLIASADGRPIPVFDLFAVPAIVLPVDNQEDLAGDIHEIIAWWLIALVGLHAIAALKHHFIDRDASLKRMLWPRPHQHHDFQEGNTGDVNENQPT